jgi:hypothetical protein
MIDDPTQVTALMRKMKAHLPIPAQATNALVRSLRASAINIASKRRMQIERVMYLGDEGVLGVVSRSQGKKTPLWWCRLRISAFRVLTRSHQTCEHTKSHARRNRQKNQTGTKFWTPA